MASALGEISKMFLTHNKIPRNDTIFEASIDFQKPMEHLGSFSQVCSFLDLSLIWKLEISGCPRILYLLILPSTRFCNELDTSV